MKAVVWQGVGKIAVSDVPDPKIQEPTDAVIRVTTSAICGTDLHLVRGTMPGMKEGTVLGHEAVGVIEEVGDAVRGFAPGERVVVCSTVACGTCSYCRAGYFSQCDTANPNGPSAGTSFFGGPETTGPVDGLQAERARIPYATSTLVKIPDPVSDDQAIMVSDVLPTGWFGARAAQVGQGDTVAVFGAGVVGQCAVASAKRQGAARVLVIDGIEERLETARGQNAEPINFNAEDPIETIKALTGGIGVDRVIDAVGIDAQSPEKDKSDAGGDRQWLPGDAPSLVSQWAVQAVAKAGSIGIIGVYPPGFSEFPIGEAMNKNLTIQMGNCPHRRFVPKLLWMVGRGDLDPTRFITQHSDPMSMVQAYEQFDLRKEGWLKTVVPM
jgi:threonine dehydrogenase-like Zn-dependent dehydrogenase